MATDKGVQLGNAEFIDDEEDFASLLEESFKKKEEDSDGIIVDIKENEVFINIGKKSEGILNISEIMNEAGELLYKVGDTIKVAIIGSRSGRPVVSHSKALRKEKARVFIDSYDPSIELDPIEVRIIGKNKGGFVAQCKDGIEFFLPKSQSGFKDDKNIIGKTYKVKVIKANKEEQSIIVSRRKILDDNRKKRKEVLEKITQSAESLKGTVKKITTYGMFVDVGGVDGLVHYSEISYKGPVNPSSLYKEGDEVLVKVISFDNDKNHLSLSIKAASIDPWDEIKESLVVGDVIKVVVSNIEPYGAFVDLGNDVEGFLHISEISWDKNIKNPKNHIKEGEEIDVEVIEIDMKDRRLRVSLKNLLAKPFDEFQKNFKQGDVAKGIVSTIAPFGAFIKIGNVEGLLHNEDLSWDRSEKCQDVFKPGDEVEVKIIKIDAKDQKISLSVKEFKQSPVQQFALSHSIGDIINGKIRDVKDFGVFVEINDNLEALIRKEDLGNIDADSLKAGDNIEAAVAFIDEKRNRIRLSVRRLAKQKEREVLNEINKDDKMTLGDIIKEKLK